MYGNVADYIEAELGKDVWEDLRVPTPTCMNDTFYLEYTIKGSMFYIDDLEVYKDRRRIGSAVVDGIHEFCVDNCFTLHAVFVRPTREAQVFWERVGFKPYNAEFNHLYCCRPTVAL